MKKLRRVCINGEWFTIKNKIVQMRRARLISWAKAKTDKSQLFRWYKKPSDNKLVIWLNWCEWADKGVTYLRVRGANPNFFSIEGLTCVGDNWYYVYVTHTHNYLYPIEIIEDEK